MASNKKDPLVSVMIPAYNADRYIKEAVDSVLMQDYSNFEVIIIDDGSTDRTWEIITSYADPRVRTIRQENSGITPTRNRMFGEARGEYFTLLDSDDIYMQGRISREVAFLEAHQEYAMVYCSLKYFFDGTPDKYYRHRFALYSGEDVFPALLKQQFITNTSIMFRREAYDRLGGYDPATGMVEDWEYFLRMLRNGYRIAHLDEDLVRYRLRWDSNTNFARQVTLKDSQVKIFEKLRSHMTEEEIKKWNIDHWLADRKKNYAIAFLSNGEKRKAWRVYQEIKHDIGFRNRAMIVTMMMVPSPMLRFAIEKAWNMRKRRLFIPIT